MVLCKNGGALYNNFLGVSHTIIDGSPINAVVNLNKNDTISVFREIGGDTSPDGIVFGGILNITYVGLTTVPSS
jgi:hypothetical protein